MPLDPTRVESAFHAARAAPDPAAYAAAAFADDPELRQRVEQLLAADAEFPTGDPLTATFDYGSAGPGPGAVIAGRYRLLEKIGEGGMGEVWVAKQTEPVQRKVAVKLIKAGMDSQRVVVRFEQERQALALMDHPNIARVLDGGMTADRRPFFVMELVNGQPLSKFCDESKLTPKERLELFIPVCQAVQHAHTKGIVHRDLKPSNVLVTLYDGRPVPKVIDFGVAKATGGRLTDESLSTQFGAVIGTFEYMAPEQAGFSALDVDTRADVYSLGVILYELLTGLRPFDGPRLRQAAFDEMVRILREEEPPKPSTRLSSDASLASAAAVRRTEPRKLAALVRGDLDWIVMKALEKDRNRRYETATGLAADVQRYLAGEPVLAVPPSAGYRLRKFVRRHRTAVTFTAITVFFALASVVAQSVQMVRANRAEVDAREALGRVTEEEQKTRTALAAVAAERTKAEHRAASVAVDLDLKFFDVPDYSTGILRLARRLPLLPADAVELRQFVVMALFAYAQTTARLAPGPALPAAHLSPDGRTLVRTDVASGGALWDLLTGKELARLWEKEDRAWHFEFSPDGRAVMMNTLAEARVWDSPTGRPRCTVRPGGGTLHKVYLDRGAARLVTVSDPDRLPDDDPRVKTLVQLWDGATGRLIATLDHERKPPVDCAFTPDGTLLVTAAGSVARVWSAADGRLVHTLAGHAGPVVAVAVSPSGGRAVTLERERLHWWSLADGRPAAVTAQLAPGQPAQEWRRARFLHDDVAAAELVGREGRDSYPVYHLCVAGEPKAHVLNPRLSDGERVLTADERVYALRPLRRLDLPAGRKYPDEFRDLAVGGRFLRPRGDDWRHDELIDLAVEKGFPFLADTLRTCPAAGCSFAGFRGAMPVVLPAADLAFDAGTLDLWARVLVRGELDPGTGLFVPHDEATWERNRQELFRRPKPPGEFPFPGAFAADRRYWLRKELDSAPQAARGPLWDRMIAAEPTWENYDARAVHFYHLENYAACLRDELTAREIAARTKESVSTAVGSAAAVALVYQPVLLADEAALVRRWFRAVGTADDFVTERAVLLIRYAKEAAALTVLHGPEVRAAARACAAFMTPVAALDTRPAPTELEDVRFLLIALCEARLGRPAVAQAYLARARAAHDRHYVSGGWSFYVGSRRTFLLDAEAAIVGKK